MFRAVDEVLGRPVVISYAFQVVVVVERDRVATPSSRERRADVGGVLERELGRVHADDDEPVLAYRAYHASRCGNVRRQFMQE